MIACQTTVNNSCAGSHANKATCQATPRKCAPGVETDRGCILREQYGGSGMAAEDRGGVECGTDCAVEQFGAR